MKALIIAASWVAVTFGLMLLERRQHGRSEYARGFQAGERDAFDRSDRMVREFKREIGADEPREWVN